MVQTGYFQPGQQPGSKPDHPDEKQPGSIRVDPDEPETGRSTTVMTVTIAIPNLDTYKEPFIRSIPGLIQSQTLLLFLKLDFITSDILDTFKCHSNALISIWFCYCDFTNITLFDKLGCFLRLETLEFTGCKGMEKQTFHSSRIK